MSVGSIVRGCILLAALAASLAHAASSYDEFVAAVTRNDVALVDAWLKRGVDPDTVDTRGDPLLLVAAREGYNDIAERLVRAGAHVNRRNGYGDSPIMQAALKGNLPLVKLLRSKRAEINHPGWTPILYAATNGHDEVIRFLLESGADVATAAPNGVTPLMMAVRGHHTQTVKLLLDYGFDPGARSEKGETALKWARDRNHQDIVALLKSAGANE